MLHSFILLVYTKTQHPRISIGPHDSDSADFARILEEGHPEMLSLKPKELPHSKVLKILNKLESQKVKMEVVSVTYESGDGAVQTWYVFYRVRLESKPSRIDGSRSDNPRVRQLRIAT
jgi:hypothetical protein